MSRGERRAHVAAQPRVQPSRRGSCGSAWDPEAAGVRPSRLVDGLTYRGHRGYAFYRDLAELTTKSRAEYSDVRDLGDRVLCPTYR